MMLENQLLNLPYVGRSHAPVLGQADVRFQPELALAIRRSYMNVRRLLSLVGVKMEPE